MAATNDKITLTGGCHCGAVRYTVTTAADAEIDDCNCSICHRSGYLGLIVPVSDFQLLQGQDDLATYTFNTGVAQHHFCRTCGVKSFYVPRSNPDGISVNLRCLDNAPDTFQILPFDGQNWEANAWRTAHRSRSQ